MPMTIGNAVIADMDELRVWLSKEHPALEEMLASFGGALLLISHDRQLETLFQRHLALDDINLARPGTT